MDSVLENILLLTATGAVTILILLISAIYTIRRVNGVWKKKNVDEQKPDQADEKKTKSDDSTATESKQDRNLQGEGINLDEIDPLEYCEHIQSEVKKAKHRATVKKLADTLSEEQLQEEREMQKNQLEAIFKLMQTQQEKFGVNSIEDVQQQMKLYA